MSYSMRPHSIRARMTAGFAVFTALLMLGFCAAFNIYARHADRQAVDAVLAEAIQEILHEIREAGHDIHDAKRLVEEASEVLGIRHVAILVVDTRNRVVAKSPPPVPVWPLQGNDWRTSSVVVDNYRIVVALPWRQHEDELRERTFLLLGLSVLVTLATAMGAWMVVGHTLSPINQLTRQAQTASTDSLHVQLKSSSHDVEIESLVTTLNDLLVRLGREAAARGRFYAAASHELRTPLQALSGHLEVALSRERSAAEYAAALNEAHSQAERLTALVRDLLTLNQLDTGSSRPPGVTIDLIDICEAELSRLQPLATQRGLHIELDLPASCEIVAPWSHMTMLLGNLLENAVKYTRGGGTMRVSLQDLVLSIYNECDPIPNWNADKYFEPFFRPDSSRNSETGGNGLGLPICKAICQSDGWTIDLAQIDGGMLVTIGFNNTAASAADTDSQAARHNFAQH